MSAAFRVSLRRRAPLTCAALLTVVTLERACDAPAPRPVLRDPRASEPVRSRMLERAGALRRAGDTERALTLYQSAASAPTVRSNERAKARAWHARLRLERGELSSLDDLDALVHDHADPALLARIAAALARFAERYERTSATHSARALQLRARCTECLKRKSRVFDEDGERAKRWLKHVAPLSR